MNLKQTKLIARLRIVLDIIPEGAETEAAMTELLEDLVISFEQIAADLVETSDEETSSTLRMIIHAASMAVDDDDAYDSNTLFLLSDIPPPLILDS